MRHLLGINNILTTKNNDSSFWLSILGNSAVLLILTVALLYSTGVIAANNDASAKSQLELNEDNATLQSKVNISHSKMTPENKKAIPANDAQIGSFSMEDGAMMGHYGDGEYED